MSIRNLSYSFVLLALLVFAGTAAAQGPVIDAATTTSNLEMTATVQTAVMLNISTGTSGATVLGDNATGLFTLDFGNVNGLGLGTPTTNVTVAADATGALYTTPINLTPLYSGFTTETADISVKAGVSAHQALAREGADASTTASVTTAVSAIANAASGSSNERVVGFYIPRSGAPAGAKTATLIYTVLVN